MIYVYVVSGIEPVTLPEPYQVTLSSPHSTVYSELSLALVFGFSMMIGVPLPLSTIASCGVKPI